MTEETSRPAEDELESVLRKALTVEEAPVPPTVDAAVCGAIQQAGARTRRRRILRPLFWATSAAACLLLALGLWFQSEPTPSSIVLAYDLNADGHVDILDAYRMHLQVLNGSADSGVDPDGDGQITLNDPRHLARAVVAFRGESN